MKIKQTQLVNNEVYHIILRAVGDSSVFNDQNDYYRGIFSIYEFNNSKPTEIWLRRIQRKKEKLLEKQEALGCPALGCPTPQHCATKIVIGVSDTPMTKEDDKRDKFVEVLAFAFMPNHIHLLLKQLKDCGISKFMQKVGGGYANYFNKKYNRKGHLFNKFKSVYITNDDQLKTVFAYIHTNPLSFVEPKWKENGIKDENKAVKFLEKEYRWSSHFDYLGKKNFPSVTNRDFLSEIMGGEQGCREAIRDWIKYKKDINNFGDIILE